MLSGIVCVICMFKLLKLPQEDGNTAKRLMFGPSMSGELG